ncbi:2-amino-4-hydroxy-6-hydroxymethyldihydropteridine pyrophosphokinase [Mucilaginibacter sp. PAMC 26640]|nr:2-amino-4-hydroxy-6-hydroxymethyldihydropteridine pyrophosphokinase [Mucilaginibacter sp. PAMC 26640]
MINVFLLLGSNLGNRQLFLQEAIRQIQKEITPVLKLSSVYETQSWGKTNLPDYLNQVILLQTSLTARALLNKILAIETELGRLREEKWGSRTIDIDILFYGDDVVNEPGLIIPHPELHNRSFTLAPLAEIAPELVHPLLNSSILTLKLALKDDLMVKKL